MGNNADRTGDRPSPFLRNDHARQACTGSLGVVKGLLLGVVLLGMVALQPPAAAQPAAGGGVPVTVAPVVRQDVPILLRNIGTVQALQSVVIRSRVDGTLEQVFFTEGQEVKRGDRLTLIDPRPYAATLAQALAKKTYDQVQLENAKRDLARTQSLVRSDFASRQQARYPDRAGGPDQRHPGGR